MSAHLRVLLVAAVLGAALAVSATAYGATVVTGTVVNSSGQPVAGVPVYLYLEDQGGVDQTVNAWASTTSASDGTYSLDLPVTSTWMNQASTNGGYVNFDVVADNGALLAYNGISRYPHPAGTCPPEIPTCRPTVEEWLDDANDEPGMPASPDAPANALTLRATATGTPVAAQTSALPGCPVGKVNLGTQNAWSVVGQLHLGNDQHASFKYGQRADSEMGVGFSSTGTSGSWSIKGSVHIGNTSGGEITLQKDTGVNGMFGKRTKTQFKTVKYKYTSCVGSHWYKIVGTKWIGSSDWGSDTNSFNGKCNNNYLEFKASFAKDGKFRRWQNHFANYSGAITVFGFGLTNRSGASTNAEENWHFGTAYNTYYLCGNDNDVLHSHRIYAGA
jgi:hypothetical protein